MALITKYVDHATGSTGGNGDVGDQWKYLWEAMAAIKTDAGTNHYKIWVKYNATAYGQDNGGAGSPSESDDVGHDGAGGDAGAVIYIDQASPGETTPNVWEGYFSSVGDGGIVVIDCNYTGASRLTNGIWCNLSTFFNTVFKNFDIQNASDDGVLGTGIADKLTFKNCRFKGNSGKGISGDNNFYFESCVFDGNSEAGAETQATSVYISCIAKNNVIGIQLRGIVIYNCLIYDNGNTYQITSNLSFLVLGSTIDSNNQAASIGIQDAGSVLIAAANCIIYDCNVGVSCGNDLGEQRISRNCLFNSNNDDSSGFITEYDGGDGAPSTGDGVGNLGHVTGVPGFTGTYVPGANAQSKGLDAHFTNAFWVSFDAAANPPFT